jgi:hypothetical protein
VVLTEPRYTVSTKITRLRVSSRITRISVG